MLDESAGASACSIRLVYRGLYASTANWSYCPLSTTPNVGYGYLIVRRIMSQCDTYVYDEGVMSGLESMRYIEELVPR